MKFKIVNMKKFIRSVILLFIAITLVYIAFSTKSYSKSEQTYKKEIISSGDTIWEIAKNEKTQNEYYKGKDIRYIVYDIQQINNISNTNLSTGQEILVPVYE